MQDECRKWVWQVYLRVRMYILRIYKCIVENNLYNKTSLSARTCSDLVIENKSHPASNADPSIFEILYTCSNLVIENKTG